MAKDYQNEMKELLEAAKANGWEYIGNNTVRRMAEHDTPDHIKDYGWWASDTYPSIEFLSFVFSTWTRAPRVVYGSAPSAWSGRRDQKISYRRAVELLGEPINASDVHKK